MRKTIKSLEAELLSSREKLEAFNDIERLVGRFDLYALHGVDEVVRRVSELVEYKRRVEASEGMFTRILSEENAKLHHLLRVHTQDPTLEYTKLTDEERYLVSQKRKKDGMKVTRYVHRRSHRALDQG